MELLKYIIFLAISLCYFSSCEEVIELDLDTTAAQLVIEANLDVSQQTATVELSKSNDFYDQATPEPVSNASIILTSDQGLSYNLSETKAGRYEAKGIVANPDQEFSISIEVENGVYEATARVPFPVDLQEVEVNVDNPLPFGGEDDETIQLTAIWNDPANTDTYYRIRTYVDTAFQADQYTVLTDEFFGDGNEHQVPLTPRFKENTTVTIELLSTDERYYAYFFQIASVVGDGANAAIPYNPAGNFSGEVLGYFGVYYSSELTVAL